MDRQIDKMMLLRRLSIISVVAFCVVVALIIGLLIVMNTGDYSGANSDFAEIDDYGEITKKTVSFEKDDTLYFFYEGYRNERTLFLDEVPNLKIVNSDKYYLEVNAPKGLIDKLIVKNTEKGIVLTFDEKYFNETTREYRTYNGLYVNCEMFDVVVYAPIAKLYSSAEFNLDFDTPKAELLAVVVGGEIREGTINNVDANNFYCQLSGASTVEISGKVKTAAHLEVWHNSKIHADNLSVPSVSTSVQSQIFGFSYVSGNGFSSYNVICWGSIITLGVVLAFIGTAFCTVLFRVWFVKQKKAVDESIDRIKAEKNSNKPQKNEENILQNGE